MLACTLLVPLMIGGQREAAPGDLQILDKNGAPTALCPLKRTSVDANISGFGAQVVVKQTFTNPTNTPIEAVYTFPLPNDAAVNHMRMRIGDRLIEADIKRRQEARQIYEQAKRAGQAAALLDQERPNIFTQSVANILPGSTVQVEITYVQLLKFENGEFEFNFPMTVGPRFLGNAADPGKIDPPRSKRVGTNVDLTVHLNPGAPVTNLRSILHEIKTVKGRGDTTVSLLKQDEIPNRDFILRYGVSDTRVQNAFLTHTDDRGGFFTLAFVPPKTPVAAQISPREVIFVMDQSGSQQGFPIQKSKELTLKMIGTLRPDDTFNVIGFANAVRLLWSEPRKNTAANIAEARKFVEAMEANGGTQLREGVVAALSGQKTGDRLRMVLFNTDGFVGDENIVLDTIQKERGHARMFSFGIGNSVNRFLLDAMAEEGRGDVEYVTLAEKADGAVATFLRRTQTPVLTDLTVKINGVKTYDVQPEALPDVFNDRPVVLYGRFDGVGEAQAVVTGKLGGKPWSQTIDLNFTAKSDAPAIPVLWARKRIAEIKRTNYIATFRGEGKSTTEEDITKLALDYGIMSEYTSFVAVEKKIINVGGKQRTVAVPVEQADGVEMNESRSVNLGMAPASATGLRGYSASGGIGGGGGGFGQGAGGFGGGTTAGVATSKSGAGAAFDAKGIGTANGVVLSAEQKKALNAAKIDNKLKAAKGTVEVQIWVKMVDEKVLAALVKAGLKVEASDKGLKIVFGTVDAAKLDALSAIDEVTRIKPL